MTTVEFFKQSEIGDGRICYVTAMARYQEKWVFSRHKKRSTWEMPGGHRESGETVEDAMKRELWEETGALEADIRPVGTYVVNGEEKCGMLYFAEITELEALPSEFEMGEIRLTDKLPEELTYPEILPALFEMVLAWMNLQSSADELWDVYDENRNLVGRTHRRGDPLEPGDYHLVVHVWMQNSKGELLITKRSPNKGYPNMWESTGGSALAGDDSLTAALREVREETGLTLDPKNGKVIASFRREDNFLDLWLFQQEFDLKDVVLQLGETTDKMYADKDAILRMVENGEFVPFFYLRTLFEAAGV